MLATEYTDGPALKAIKMVFEYLPRAYKNGGSDPEAIDKMANAATLAGMAWLSVRRILRESLGPSLEAMGFEEREGGVWARPLGSDFVVLWLQLGPVLFDEGNGRCFTLWLQASPSERPRWRGERHTRGRLRQRLTPAELGLAIQTQGAIRQKGGVALGEEAPEHGYFDFWLLYWDEDDVRTWAGFLAQVLPRLVADAEKEHAQNFGPPQPPG